jgi:hypothetical protein
MASKYAMEPIEQDLVVIVELSVRKPRGNTENIRLRRIDYLSIEKDMMAKVRLSGREK